MPMVLGALVRRVLMQLAMRGQTEYYALHRHRRNGRHKTGTYNDEVP